MSRIGKGASLVTFTLLAASAAAQTVPLLGTPATPPSLPPLLKGAPTASVALGGVVFRQSCARCHSTERGGLASLRGVFNAGAGQRPGIATTTTLKYSGKIWNAAQLDHFLADPVNDLPGTSMQGAKLSDPDDRRNVIAYLMTLQ